jgi:hypothetical protein
MYSTLGGTCRYTRLPEFLDEHFPGDARSEVAQFAVPAGAIEQVGAGYQIVTRAESGR